MGQSTINGGFDGTINDLGFSEECVVFSQWEIHNKLGNQYRFIGNTFWVEGPWANPNFYCQEFPCSSQPVFRQPMANWLLDLWKGFRLSMVSRRIQSIWCCRQALSLFGWWFLFFVRLTFYNPINHLYFLQHLSGSVSAWSQVRINPKTRPGEMHMAPFTPGADYKFKEGFLVTAGSLQKGFSTKAEGKAATQKITAWKGFLFFRCAFWFPAFFEHT